LRELSRGLEAHLLRACGDALHKAAASGVDPVTAEE
jgi:RNA-directed DNA polymerase